MYVTWLTTIEGFISAACTEAAWFGAEGRGGRDRDPGGNRRKGEEQEEVRREGPSVW